MTPFHRARATAIQVRTNLFGVDSASLITSAAIIDAFAHEDAEDFDISPVNPSDSILGGADAVLVRNFQQIFVRNDVSTAERAFLIAHEFGHWKLHVEGQEGCHSVVDMALKPEAAETMGAQKVEAYGARERAELQANVFARELLLPRKVARSFFLAGGTAHQLVNQLDLPLELVRHQLLDALLLPEPVRAEEPASAPITPTPEQWVAATSKEPVSLVVAGPGTGKTATLVMRVQHLIAQGVKPSELLLLTFSNRAAREMMDRLEQLSVPDAHEIWVGTFHAFGLEFLRKNYQHFDLTPQFGVADKMAQIAVLEPHIYNLGLNVFNPLGDPLDWLNEVVRAIQRAKDELADAEAYTAAIAGHTAADNIAKLHDIAKLYRCYEAQLKAKGNLVDLGDLVRLPAIELMKDYAKYQVSVGRFKHILVDEYQDVNRASAQLVKALAAHADSLWVVGDARQAIYRFRGASMRNIVHFNQDFPQHATFYLNENRRSFEEVIRVFEHTGRNTNPLQQVLPLDDVEPKRGTCGIKPLHIECADNRVVHGELSKQVRRIHASGISFRGQVILASNHETCGAAADALNNAGVPALHVGDIFQHPAVKSLLTLLQLFVDRSGSGLVLASRLPGLEISRPDVTVLVGWLKKNRPEPLSWLKSPPSCLSPEGIAAVKQWECTFSGFSSRNSPWDVVCDLLLSRTTILHSSLEGSSVLDITRRIALWQFIYYLRVPEGGHSYQTVGSFLTRFRRRLRLGDDRELRIPPPEADSLDAVAVMTIHGSKGLEFDAVHLVDIGAQHFTARPDNATLLPDTLQNTIQLSEAQAEASNKLYVALSRARQHLVLYERKDAWKAECAPAIINASHLLQKELGSAVAHPPPVQKAVMLLDGITAPVNFLALLAYRVCPRRYYYEHVLDLHPTAGMHPASAIEAAAVRDLFMQHGADANVPSAEVAGVLANLSSDFAGALPTLRVYADKLLASGRGWLGAQRAAMPQPFDVSCDGLPLQVQAHRISGSGKNLTIEFVRSRPAGKLNRQREALRWMLKHLTAAHPGYSFKCSIFVLSTGDVETVFADRQSFSNKRLEEVVNGIRSGDVTARPNQWECPKCRHFMYCPA
ncbi:MAG TPA: UvrD-helicase domain-containing protein [Burkholderiaceae bacterium]|nr:UvrD-helicase domain-containing protein [Burkholderiaceae bacterium]